MARPDFEKIWGSSRATIPAIGGTDYASGWAAYLGIIPPSTDDHDYVMNLQDERAVWLKDQALLAVGHEWQEDVTYDLTAYVRPEGGGALYKSLVSPNTGNEPTASPSQWRVVTIDTVEPASTTVAGIIEIATAAEAQAFTANKAIDGAALNNAFKGGNQSLSASPWQRFPGGLIQQFGTSASVAVDTNVTITFPIAFPSFCRSVFAVCENPETGNDDVFARVVSKTATQVVLRAELTPSGVATGTRAINWMATGY